MNLLVRLVNPLDPGEIVHPIKSFMQLNRPFDEIVQYKFELKFVKYVIINKPPFFVDFQTKRSFSKLVGSLSEFVGSFSKFVGSFSEFVGSW